MNRREFFFGWILPQRTVGLPVEVMEVFSASNWPSALLVHHASEASRNAFAEWLRTHSGMAIACRLSDGTRLDARIFRVSMCFGRGLILTRLPSAIRQRDILSIEPD